MGKRPKVVWEIFRVFPGQIWYDQGMKIIQNRVFVTKIFVFFEVGWFKVFQNRFSGGEVGRECSSKLFPSDCNRNHRHRVPRNNL